MIRPYRTLKLPRVTLKYNRRHDASATHPSAVEVYITYDGKVKIFSTGLFLLPSEWSRGRVVGRMDSLQKNQWLDQLMIDIGKVINKMVEEKRIDIFAIPRRLNELRVSDIDLFEFMRKRAEIRCHGNGDDSIERYQRFIRRFGEWGKIKSFSDITEHNIIELDKYLDSRQMKDKSKWNNWHRFLNSFIKDGIDEGYIQKNPYKWLNIRRGDEDISIDDYLTFEELRQMANTKMPSVRLERVRDLFIFQCYTCLSYADLFKFDAKRIEIIEGKKTYFDERKKGHGKYGKFVVPMLPKALEILDKYNGQLPIISNTKYNKYIKEVAEETGISQRLHTHLARHTGATMLLNAGVPLNVVSKILGHKNTRITERIYAKLLDKTIVQEVNKVEDKL